MRIYVDAIFLLNVLFDAILLMLTGYITKDVKSLKRIALGSLYCGCSVFITLSPFHGFIGHPLGKLLFSIGIIAITFFPRTLKKWLFQLLTLYAVTFSLGGFVIGLNLFFQQSVVFQSGVLITRNGGYGDPVTWLFVLIIFPVSAFLYKKYVEQMKMEDLKSQSLVPSILEFENFVLPCTGLIDTGNQLTDPISGLPVIVVDTKKLEERLPKDLVKFINQTYSYSDLEYNQIWEKYKLKLLPFKSLGNENGLLYCMRPKGVILHHGEKQVYCTEVLAGFSPHTLSNTGDFDCILNIKIFVNEREIA